MRDKYIKTAFSSHTCCFICRNARVRLHKIQKESIIKAYLNYRILIKQDTRCCQNHLDQYGQLLMNEYDNIPTRLLLFNELDNISIDYLVNSNKSGIFDKFKNIGALDESLCKKITGWNRAEFMNFSKYIMSVRDSNGRTKEQLIAIYRFWLRKGCDQFTLSQLKDNSTQQQMSHYLEQIRNAILKDFVPHFIGTRKNRDFYIKHNTPMSVELYGLKDDDLIIVCDGTYTPIEKSANNDFQYKSYSSQKKDLLMKPFIICCADGYIIDCYGPFQANLNDAVIFEYILEMDQSLRRILQPFKTHLLLDRGMLKLQSQLEYCFIFGVYLIYIIKGFRDVFEKLKKVYNFSPKMPYCNMAKAKKIIDKDNKDDESDSESEDSSDDERNKKTKVPKHLTTQQANESRLVTKVHIKLLNIFFKL